MVVKVYLAGDSTVKTYDETRAPQAGWGQFIAEYFTSYVIFENHAEGGRSTKTFIEEGRLQKILQQIRPGDYLFIQMGHNDSAINKQERYTEPQTTYKQYLREYIAGAREKQAIPLLITPVSRLAYQDETFVTNLEAYAKAMLEVAVEDNVAVIDLNKRSLDYYSSLGYEKTVKLFMLAYDGHDHTHFTFTGAKNIGALIVKAIKELDIELSRYVK